MKKSQYFKYFLSLLFCCYAFPTVSHSFQQTDKSAINHVINSILAANDHPLLDSNTFSIHKKTIDDLYFLSPQHLLWINTQNRDNHKVAAVLQLIATAKNSGLKKEHYNLALLNSQWHQLSTQQNVSYDELALLDTAISFNLLHFLSDLHFGRINPVTLNFNFKSKKESFTFIPSILQSIKNNTISSLSTKVEPTTSVYHKLKQALFDFRQLETDQSYKWLKITTTLHPGDTSQQIVVIRQRVNGQAGVTIKIDETSHFYDEKFVETIKGFQFRHGLKMDGIIGKKTIKALNIPLSHHIQQIELSMERLRWLPKIKPGPMVMVNIPAFQLWAYNTDKPNESKILNMKVIVGESVERKSPVFTADMYYLEFSPYWNIPKSIVIEEVLPKLQQDPLYLEQQEMELVVGFHNSENALPFAEDSIMQLEKGLLKLRQRPGRKNALGKVKFIFPNNYNVYLHDTPSQHLFNKAVRDLSHGCIRIEKPTELAHFLLASKPGWNQQKVKKAMRLQQPKQVRLKKAIPVIIFYATAFVVHDEIVFYDDIYDYDAQLSQALNEHNRAQKTSLSTLLTGYENPVKKLPITNIPGINMNKI